MNPVPDECKYLFESTTHIDYYNKSKGHKRPEPFIQAPNDPVLINGQKENNLLIDNKPIPYKTCHPYVKNNHEEYVEFIKKIPCIDKNVFCKHFLKPEPEPKLLPGIFMENKTLYQKDYSPTEYTPRNENIQMRHHGASGITPMECKHEKTTYTDSYNRISELKDLKNISKVTPFCEDTRKRILQDELQTIYKTGLTIYHTEICQPAILRMNILKKKNLLKNGPLDQYTLRKL